MGYVKWTFIIVFWLLLGALLHYALPQRDIVRVTGTEIIRKDFSGLSSWFYAQNDTGDAVTENRDLRLINSTRPNGNVMVYRNEDTGFGWPPYFKVDSSNLHAEAANVISTAADPQWVAVRHYGWRNPFLSIYPNAVAIVPVEGPDVRLIPWFNIIFLTFLAALFWGIYVRWRRFRQARIDPALDRIEDRWDAAGANIDARRGRFRRWLDTFKGKPRV
ncbi:DUF1523 family protein [Algirhabdus cladophorae]|uniref:DUF1523 family protein n=1 Tax=Algirhabdus cladophorae TaxID=3377108 RepID=UPI003B846005